MPAVHSFAQNVMIKSNSRQFSSKYPSILLLYVNFIICKRNKCAFESGSTTTPRRSCPVEFQNMPLVRDNLRAHPETSPVSRRLPSGNSPASRHIMCKCTPTHTILCVKSAVFLLTCIVEGAIIIPVKLCECTFKMYTGRFDDEQYA